MIESLLQVVCVDKTGTLTTNAMCVARVATPASMGRLHEFTVNVSEAPSPPSGDRPSSIAEANTLKRLARPSDVPALLWSALAGSVCNDAELTLDETTGEFTHVGESAEAALRLFAERVGLPGWLEAQSGVRIPSRFPFTYPLQRMYLWRAASWFWITTDIS
jgi:P-type Ca2+ transporter type 2A